MIPDPNQATELVAFVRDVLGCGCPDEILDNMSYETSPTAFAGLPVDSVINAGNRLLVGICRQGSLDRLEGDLVACVEAGRKYRDSGGFNRFRLVIPGEPDDGNAESRLIRRFDNLECVDDRIHVHLVDASTLPELLISKGSRD